MGVINQVNYLGGTALYQHHGSVMGNITPHYWRWPNGEPLANLPPFFDIEPRPSHAATCFGAGPTAERLSVDGAIPIRV